MIVEIISSESIENYQEIVWIEITTTIGNFIILPGHAPIIVTLVADKPIILMQKNEKSDIINLQRPALLEFIDDQAHVII